MQRAWLRITAAGLAAQPMMSLPVLINCQRLQMLPHATSQVVAASQGRIRKLVGFGASASMAAILRFGYAEPARARTGRRHPQEVTRWISSVTQSELSL
jgi:hypothetical protein